MPQPRPEHPDPPPPPAPPMPLTSESSIIPRPNAASGGLVCPSPLKSPTLIVPPSLASRRKAAPQRANTMKPQFEGPSCTILAPFKYSVYLKAAYAKKKPLLVWDDEVQPRQTCLFSGKQPPLGR